MKRTHIVIGFVCLILATLYPGALSASYFRFVTIDELARKSDAVVVGIVEKVTGHRAKDSNGIYALAAVRVSDVAKGTITKERIIVEFKGGRLPDGTLAARTPNDRQLFTGEHLVLFLKLRDSRIMDGVSYHLTHSNFGAIPVDDSGLVRYGKPPEERGKKLIVQTLPLQEFVEMIRKMQ